MIRFKTFITLLMVYCTTQCYAQMGYTVNPSEYQVKAKFLYNFARFVQWPSDRFADNKTPITIAIIGNDPFGIDIDKTVEGKFVDGRTIKILHSRNMDTLDCCHILFINMDEEKQTAEILNHVKNQSVLTVGEKKGFLQLGGIINFIIRDNKVRFEINEKAAEQSGIWISAQLLKIASSYKTQS